MSRRKILPCTTNSRATKHTAGPRHAPTRSSPQRHGGAFGALRAERAAMPWPCLLSSIAVGVAPLRNLTGDADQENLLDAFTSDLAADLTRHGRGFSLRCLAKEPVNLGEQGVDGRWVEVWGPHEICYIKAHKNTEIILLMRRCQAPGSS